jgi:hypothetical protein
MIAASIVWRRLDTAGHEACVLNALEPRDAGWQLEGAAVFLHEGLAARLTYDLTCDGSWRTLHGEVHGSIGTRPIELHITRASDGLWTCNGAVVPGLDGCVDLDLGFSPATNLLQLRRLGLTEGQSAPAPVAWLDAAAGTLDLLEQRYERRSERTYWYEAPRFQYAALLEVSPTGFVSRYPGLWEAVCETPTAP